MIHCHLGVVCHTRATVTMSIAARQIRSGAYCDSVVLTHLQRSLVSLPGVPDAGVVMGIVAISRMRNEEPVARARTLWEWVDAATGRPMPIRAAPSRILGRVL